MPSIRVELTSDDLKTLVVRELRHRLGDVPLDAKRVKIEVKSRQNYRAEWEEGDFRAVFELGQVAFEHAERGA